MFRSHTAQAGALLVEFALVVVFLLMLLFGVIEVARAMYVWNTLQEVTRRVAAGVAVIDPNDEAAKSLVRQRAIFRTSPGVLSFGAPVTDEHIRVDYLSLARNSDGSMVLTEIPSGLLPACPARNRLNCTADPNAGNCVRFVRVRLCAPSGDAGTCNAVQYAPLTGLATLTASLPTSTTILKAGTLGYQPGMALCP